MKYQMIRNANIEVNPVISNGDILTNITVNDSLSHTFCASSRLSKAYNKSSNSDQIDLVSKQLQQRLNNGNFFFVNDQLVDFRDNHYNGFIHSDSNIDNLVDVLGITPAMPHDRSSIRSTTTNSDYLLMNKSSASSFNIEGYQQGGEFDSRIIFQWNPFMSYVKGMFEIVRQICSNGMVSSTNLVNSNVPLINKWEEHLVIANTQLQNKVQHLTKNRLSQMGKENATVSELLLLTQHANTRFNESSDQNERSTLDNIRKISDPIFHLSKFYNDSVFKTNDVAAQVPGHLTKFDLWNMITEVNSHTNPCEDSSFTALQKFANSIVFDSKDNNIGKNKIYKPLISSFSDPDQAFFGTIA